MTRKEIEYITENYGIEEALMEMMYTNSENSIPFDEADFENWMEIF